MACGLTGNGIHGLLSESLDAVVDHGRQCDHVRPMQGPRAARRRQRDRRRRLVTFDRTRNEIRRSRIRDSPREMRRLCKAVTLCTTDIRLVEVDDRLGSASANSSVRLRQRYDARVEQNAPP